MATLDLTYAHSYPIEHDAPVLVVPHEETDLHRVFCDDAFCLDRAADQTGVAAAASLR